MGMMIRLSTVALVTFLSNRSDAQVIIPGSVGKSALPTGPSSMLEWLETKSHPHARNLLPPRREDEGMVACSVTVMLPDSIAFISGQTFFVGLWVDQLASSNYIGAPKWSKVSGHIALPDTLRARVVDVRCSRGWGDWRTIEILAERNGIIFHPPATIRDFDPGEFGDSGVRVIEPGGALYTPLLRRTCPLNPDPCFTVLSARSYRDSVAAAKVAEERAERTGRVAEARRAAAVRAARLRAIRSSGWPSGVIQDVLAGRVRIGMTAAQVRMSWGPPDDINRTITAFGRTEQWVYGSGSYVYLRNGQVVSIQN